MLKNIKVSPCWILSHPRSGSSFLCELLNNTMLFPHFDHEKIRTDDYFLRKGKGRAFDEWLRLFSSKNELFHNLPHFVKVIYDQLFSLCDNLCIEEITQILPNINFIYLERKNKIDQAVSLYIAKKLDAYHVFTNNFLQKCRDTNLDINKEEIKKCYDEVVNFQDWAKFIKNQRYHHVYYETLIENPKNVLEDILCFLNLPKINLEESVQKANNCILKLNHNKTQEIKDCLKGYVV